MEEEKQVETETKECPNCSAAMKFSIKDGALKCTHCGYIQEIENDDKVVRKQLTDEVITSKREWSDGSVFQCENCGAKEVVNQKDITRKCPFCGSNNIVSINELSGVKPDAVIPFKVSNDDAHGLFGKWMKSKKWAPRAFKTADIREHINRLYCPSWSFTAPVNANYDGTLGKSESRRVRTSSGQYTTQTYTNWFNVSGSINEQYTDFLIQSSDRISPINFTNLKPFDMKEVKVYRTEYITGIVAEHYTRDLDLCFKEFSNSVRADLRQKIMRRHNADCVQRLNINLNFPNKQFNYILLPIYVSNYMYNKKNYNFYINGVSGKIVGKYPVSKWKVCFAVLGFLAVAAVVGVLAWLNM